jgi:hypothetical protein
MKFIETSKHHSGKEEDVFLKLQPMLQLMLWSSLAKQRRPQQTKQLEKKEVSE